VPGELDGALTLGVRGETDNAQFGAAPAQDDGATVLNAELRQIIRSSNRSIFDPFIPTTIPQLYSCTFALFHSFTLSLFQRSMCRICLRISSAYRFGESISSSMIRS
jgi:hypothetical protein